MRRFAWQVGIGIVSGGATIATGFMLEKLFLEEWEWWHWGILALLFIAMTIYAGWKLHGMESPLSRDMSDLREEVAAQTGRVVVHGDVHITHNHPDAGSGLYRTEIESPEPIHIAGIGETVAGGSAEANGTLRLGLVHVRRARLARWLRWFAALTGLHGLTSLASVLDQLTYDERARKAEQEYRRRLAQMGPPDEQSPR